jgi:antitoxin CcdA
MGKVELKIAIDAELLARAEAAGISVEEFLNSRLRAALPPADNVSESGPAFAHLTSEEKAARWAAENANAIADHRRRIEAYGIFGEEFRTW